MGTIFLIGMAVIAFCVYFVLKDGGGKDRDSSLTLFKQEHDFKADYDNSKIFLESKNKRLIVIDGKTPVLLCAKDIRDIRQESVAMPYGGLEKPKFKDCRLLVGTFNLDQPTISIPFSNKPELDEWFNRLSIVFC
jgi:hypothetical protein